MSRRYGHTQNDWAIPTAAIVGTSALATTAVVGTFLYQNVSEYGWEGTVRLIWEGDAYGPQLRQIVDALEQAEVDRSLQESRIYSMEAALDLARLNTVDDGGATGSNVNRQQVVEKWIEYFSSSTTGTSSLSLERTLADVSDKLDKIAAKIDSLILQKGAEHDHFNSNLVKRIKQRKKLLSKSIVLDMERCDVLLGSYQVLKEK